MYIAECLAWERQRDLLEQAQQARTANGLAELRRLEKWQHRAERELLHAWERVEHLRSRLEAG
jgi:hypothetical protein